MTAITLANDRPTSLDDDLYQWAIDAAAMLRKQDAAIKQLRVAIEQVQRYPSWPHTSCGVRSTLEAALAATEEICKN